MNEAGQLHLRAPGRSDVVLFGTQYWSSRNYRNPKFILVDFPVKLAVNPARI